MAGGDPRLLLVGGGRMGGALLRGWLEKGIAAPDAVTVIEPADEARAALAALGVRALAAPDDILDGRAGFDLVLLALKPQVMDEAGIYAPLGAGGAVFLSIAAGKTTAYFRALLGASAAVVRAMPNTPAQVGRGITALFATAEVDGSGRALAGRLMEAVGEVVWLEDEALMDAVTAVSGSGPAYLFYLIECLAAAARQAGLADDLAERLARATVTGAGELAHLSTEPAAILRQQVTSPGGTTAAALEVLMAEGGLEELMVRAVAAAADRSRELAG
ncbi:MAG: pyrroline-5-carboxylate reductase [Alphaproteobacteria bacterium]|nr:pyrroline-5-carboxylate reductase [Alphaproteobacteria bacterium]